MEAVGVFDTFKLHQRSGMRGSARLAGMVKDAFGFDVDGIDHDLSRTWAYPFNMLPVSVLQHAVEDSFLSMDLGLLYLFQV